MTVSATSELRLVTLHQRNFTYSKGFRCVCVIIFPIWFLFNCNSGLQPTQPQLTFLFLIRTFLAPRQSHWLRFFPCHQANLRFPLRDPCGSLFQTSSWAARFQNKAAAHCNYNMTINRANQQLTQQHLSSTQFWDGSAVWHFWKTRRRKNQEYPMEDIHRAVSRFLHRRMKLLRG